MQITEALLRAILELIDKCDTLEELRASVNRIMGPLPQRPLQPLFRGGREPYPVASMVPEFKAKIKYFGGKCNENHQDL